MSLSGVLNPSGSSSPSGGGGSCSSRRAALRVTRALGIYSAQRRAQVLSAGRKTPFLMVRTALLYVSHITVRLRFVILKAIHGRRRTAYQYRTKNGFPVPTTKNVVVWARASSVCPTGFDRLVDQPHRCSAAAAAQAAASPAAAPAARLPLRRRLRRWQRG